MTNMARMSELVRHDYYEKELSFLIFLILGPNELSFCDVNAIQPIMGTEGMPKGPSM